MIKHFFILIATFFVLSSFVSAKPLVVMVQSTFIQPYDEAVRGFKSTWRGENKNFVLSEHPSLNLTDNIKKEVPDLLLAVGLGALEVVKALPDIPIIYSMVLSSDVAALSSNNITGVCMQVPAKIQLQKISLGLPNLKRIGVLYDPNESENVVKEALKLSPQFGVTLLAKPVQTPREISSALMQMRGQVEVIWMLPDLTVRHPPSMELFTLFSFENGVPLVTYSEKYLEMGAFMSIGVDAFDMGRQAGEIANRIIFEGGVVESQFAEARSPIVTINKTIADKFGIEINKTKAIGKVKVWNR
jgi:ABC-type uncharacterized transport system substrate-binding protein